MGLEPAAPGRRFFYVMKTRQLDPNPATFGAGQLRDYHIDDGPQYDCTEFSELPFDIMGT